MSQKTQHFQTKLKWHSLPDCIFVSKIIFHALIPSHNLTCYLWSIEICSFVLQNFPFTSTGFNGGSERLYRNEFLWNFRTNIAKIMFPAHGSSVGRRSTIVDINDYLERQ